VEPWRARLSQGETQAAWDLFIDRYRRLIFATIRRTIQDHEDALDVFTHVCDRLSADNLARLEKYTDHEAKRARFSTWLVVVVRNQTIDWVRAREGRRRVSVPEALSPIQRKIFHYMFADRRSRAETYELMCADGSIAISFGSFLREVAETYRMVEHTRGVMRYFPAPEEAVQGAKSPEDALMIAEAGGCVSTALESLPADVRLALQLFVIDELSASDVARLVGWPNAKTVYNRVHRGLVRLRKELERRGIGPTDI